MSAEQMTTKQMLAETKQTFSDVITESGLTTHKWLVSKKLSKGVKKKVKADTWCLLTVVELFELIIAAGLLDERE